MRPLPFLPAGIRARLFLLIILTLVPLVLLLGAAHYKRYDNRRTQALQSELEVAQGVATTFAAYVHGIRRQNHALGEAILGFSSYTEAKASRLLAATAAQYPSVRSINWISPQGKILASSHAGTLGSDLSRRPAIRAVMGGRPWVLGDLAPSGVSAAAPVFEIVTALRSGSGRLLGMVVTAVEPSRLGQIALTQRRPPGSAYVVYDSRGVLVFRSPALPFTWEERLRWPKEDPTLRRTLETGRPQVGMAELPVGGRWISARVPIPSLGWVAGAGRRADGVLAPLGRDLLLDLSLALSVSLLAFLLAYLLARTISGPLLHLERDARAMGSGRIAGAPHPAAPSEVRRLRGTVEAMATDLLRKSEDLRESEERFRQLADAMPQLVWTARPDGTVDYYNRRTEEFKGFSLDCEGCWKWAPVLHPDDLQPTVEAWETAVRTGRTYQIAHRVQNADGVFRWYLSRGVPARDESGRIVKWYGTATDIHDLRQAQEELRAVNEELEKRVAERTAELEAANRELNAFNYSISHDLRAPLRAMDGFSQALLEDYFDRLDETGRDYLQRVRAAAQRMAALIDDQLRLSRISRAELRCETVDLSALAGEIAEELRQREPGRSVEWIIRPALTAFADRGLLKIALENLLGNAWKFTAGKPDARIEIGAEGSEPAFFVRDNGAGFDMTQAGRLFEPYRRLHSEKEFPGIGIGTTIVQRIVQRHGGRVWAEGAPGGGAVFRFTLPVGAKNTEAGVPI